MFLGFLGSGHRVEDENSHRQPSAGRVQIARTLISLGLMAAVVVLGLQGLFFWLDTGRWPGIGLFDLERFFSTRSAPEVFGRFVGWLLAKIPVSLILLAVAAWIAWKVFPRAQGPASALGLQTMQEIRTAVRAITGDSLVIVSRQRPRLFEYLKEEYQGNPTVHVILDRRWGENRLRHEERYPERRRTDRRERPDTGRASLATADVIVTPHKPKARATIEQSNQSQEDPK